MQQFTNLQMPHVVWSKVAHDLELLENWQRESEIPRDIDVCPHFPALPSTVFCEDPFS